MMVLIRERNYKNFINRTPLIQWKGSSFSIWKLDELEMGGIWYCSWHNQRSKGYCQKVTACLHHPVCSTVSVLILEHQMSSVVLTHLWLFPPLIEQDVIQICMCAHFKMFTKAATIRVLSLDKFWFLRSKIWPCPYSHTNLDLHITIILQVSCCISRLDPIVS